MSTYEKINGGILLATNTPGTSTGYGVQAKFLVDMFTRHGIKTGVASNFGLEGFRGKMTTPFGSYLHYPKGYKPYSDDVIPIWYDEFKGLHPKIKTVLMTLYDTWVFNDLVFDDPIWSYVPLDHVTLPPGVAKFLSRDNVNPITMSPHGKRQLDQAGIDNVYIPHVVDTTVFKPTHKINGMATRKFMGVPDDAFLVSMVSANKANKLVHRKALAEQLMAFSMFQKKFPNSYLYLHMESSSVFGGFTLAPLLESLKLSPENVMVADSNTLRTGYPNETLAALYTASDVLMCASYGEGFGVPIIESQACGTPVITSNWSATQDLASESSWLVDGQPFWDAAQLAYYQIPFINSIVNALEMAHDADRGVDQTSIDFAKQFGHELVWQTDWMPLLKKVFA